ncbi:MAG: hypothetical protein JSS79_09210 [Bacteroidetes bacterium]|nr:hypothetical protein [Bacteroidota bacterium]
MRVEAQNFKGIEYVQISSLPVNQQNSIRVSINRKLIIIILKGDDLIKDCLQYRDYVNWYENVYKIQLQEEKSQAPASPQHSFALALK